MTSIATGNDFCHLPHMSDSELSPFFEWLNLFCQSSGVKIEAEGMNYQTEKRPSLSPRRAVVFRRPIKCCKLSGRFVVIAGRQGNRRRLFWDFCSISNERRRPRLLMLDYILNGVNSSGAKLAPLVQLVTCQWKIAQNKSESEIYWSELCLEKRSFYLDTRKQLSEKECSWSPGAINLSAAERRV